LKQFRDEDDILIIYRILLLTKYKYKICTYLACVNGYLRSLHEYTYKIQRQKSTNIATIRWLNKLPAYYTGVSVVKRSNLGGSESRDEQRRHSFPVSYILHGHSCAPEITRIFDGRLGINKDAIVKRVNTNLIIPCSFN